MNRIEKHPIVDELEKQYEVEAVDLSSPISRQTCTTRWWPCSHRRLLPDQFERLVDAVKSGVPTAIFEDPFPFARQDIPGTGAPKQAPSMGMFGGGGSPQPKGDIRNLWDVLELQAPGKPGHARLLQS